MPEPKPSAEVLRYLKGSTPFAGDLAARLAVVLERVSTAAGCGWRHVVGGGSHPSITAARRAVAKALRDLDLGEGRKLSLSEIGLILGKDHSTVGYYLGMGKQPQNVANPLPAK